MPNELSQIVVPVVIGLFVFWLLYRIKRMVANIIKSKIVNEFPHITEQLENFQLKIDYLNSRIDAFERKVNELENKIKNQ